VGDDPTSAPDHATILLTVDSNTERLYIYSTVCQLPTEAPAAALGGVYRALLQWALLGRDAAGGGVGLDPQSGAVLLAMSIDLRTSAPHALRDQMPLFVEALIRWRRAAAGLLKDNASDRGESHQRPVSMTF
jgi:hypothetical protein